MALNANNLPHKAKANRAPQQEIEIGNYMSRLVQVIDTGIQYKDVWNPATNSFIKDTEHAPVQHMMTTYELLTEFMKDEQGNDDEAHPRWLSEEWPLYPLDQDLATTTKRYNGLDPKQEKAGDWSLLANQPCQLNVVHKKSGKAKIGAVAPAIKGIPYPELKNDTKVYLMEDGDNEVFRSLPEWIQERIRGALNFWGKDGAVKAEPQAPKEPEPIQQNNEPQIPEMDLDNPF